MIAPKEMKKLREENAKLKIALKESNSINTKILRKWKKNYENKMLNKVRDVFLGENDESI